MRIALIENGTVSNISVGDELPVNGVSIDFLEVDIGDIYQDGQFSKPAISIEQIKAAKLEQIEQDRDAQCRAPVYVHGRQWQADSRSQELLSQAITLCSAGLPLPAAWRDVDNANMVITSLADLLAIAGAIAAQTQTAYAVSWARKAALEAATTMIEIEAI